LEGGQQRENGHTIASGNGATSNGDRRRSSARLASAAAPTDLSTLGGAAQVRQRLLASALVLLSGALAFTLRYSDPHEGLLAACGPTAGALLGLVVLGKGL